MSLSLHPYLFYSSLTPPSTMIQQHCLMTFPETHHTLSNIRNLYLLLSIPGMLFPWHFLCFRTKLKCHHVRKDFPTTHYGILLASSVGYVYIMGRTKQVLQRNIGRNYYIVPLYLFILQPFKYLWCIYFILLII